MLSIQTNNVIRHMRRYLFEGVVDILTKALICRQGDDHEHDEKPKA